jgi:hypothetical protein
MVVRGARLVRHVTSRPRGRRAVTRLKVLAHPILFISSHTSASHSNNEGILYKSTRDRPTIGCSLLEQHIPVREYDVNGTPERKPMFVTLARLPPANSACDSL